MADSTEPIHKEGEEDTGGHYEPVIKLTEQVESKTHEEDEDVVLKLRAKLFRFDPVNSEWKERGTGEVRLLQFHETKKFRLLMRRDKTYKVCANHLITSDMKLQPNIGSDRSWVWKVAADIADGVPTAETLAIRFANAENANIFKTHFEEAQRINASLSSGVAVTVEKEEEEPKAEGTQDAVLSSDPASVTHDPAAAEGSVEPASTSSETQVTTGAEAAEDSKAEEAKAEETKEE